ncbi:MAG: hypothetical protein J6R47_01105 [Acholeplasmatales bacterium]|nr:hypothetical protein [Acholeplasmatales bacterium]
MPLVYWYKDSNKQVHYYDTDDLNNQQYAEVCRLEKEMHKDNRNYFKLKEQRDRIIRLALMGSEGIYN